MEAALRFVVLRVAIVALAAALCGCNRGSADETELAFCAAVERNDAQAAKAIFDAGKINMQASNLSGKCQPLMKAFGAARPHSPEFTSIAVALAKREGIAKTCWSVPTGSNNSRTSGGELCPIQTAARNANPVVMKALIEAGVDVRNNAAKQAMLDAVGQNALTVVQMLVDAGADPNTALPSAVGSHRIELIAYLESKGARENVDTLLVAARQGDLSAVDAAIGRHANLEVKDAAGRTPLMRAAMYGHPAILTRLAMAGANLEQTMDGETALHIAARENQAASIKALAAARANLNAHGASAQSPIEVAVNSGAVQATAALVDAGADANAFNESDTTVIGSAIASGNLALVRALLRGGARVNDKRGAGWRPPIHVTLAICGLPPEGAGDNDNDRLTLLRTLVNAGADRTAKDPQGRTATEAVTLLLADTQEPFRRACLEAKRDYLASLR